MLLDSDFREIENIINSVNSYKNATHKKCTLPVVRFPLPTLEESEVERNKNVDRITNKEHKFGFGVGFDYCYEWITKTGVYNNGY